MIYLIILNYLWKKQYYYINYNIFFTIIKYIKDYFTLILISVKQTNKFWQKFFFFNNIILFISMFIIKIKSQLYIKKYSISNIEVYMFVL